MESPNSTFAPGEENEQQKKDFLIVGIGASSGGIQAMQVFFEHVPANSGMAYVVILHLSPDHDSKLAEVLQAVSHIPVSQVREKVLVEPDHVYVIPPNKHLTMEDGYILVSPNIQVEERRAPVDIFFRSLAESHGAGAVCVVLSGTGANGSMGLKRIKELGGVAFVQNPRESEFNEMPRNAITTDLVDEVLPVAEIPQRIIDYRNSIGTVRILLSAEKGPESQQQALREIFTQLKVKTGHDFSNYKRPTLLRRIERRINIRNLPDLPSYASFLQDNPEEVVALLKDLLISVTNFFRDKKAFEILAQQVLPMAIKGKTAEQQLRIWIAGCATGEEAYSIAILCAELLDNELEAPKIQIFATDIDEGAINHAREGLYTLNDAADISPERLRRFFNKEGESYRIRREIREMILFANHNFLKDPPFSHLDIVSCRNVLIYLNRTAQERAMDTFHFALNQGGFLLLGSSESADSWSDLFVPFNREFHIFQSRKKLLRPFPVPESLPSLKIEQPRLTPAAVERESRSLERISFGDLHQRLLEEYAPPSILINEEYEIAHISDRAGRYLQISGGEPSQNLLKLIRQELRLELRSALYQALQHQTAVEARGLKVTVNDKIETINIHIRPVLQGKEVVRGYILVLFEKVTEEKPGRDVILTTGEPVARQLEAELVNLKAQLRASNEQHEFNAEELKASNEELQAMNEELRSAAEELETSKEELQSINEELRTVNQELKVKIEETSLAGNNLQNLINSASIGTIFLDRGFRVALFTPAAREIFNLIPADLGRPLSDITHHLEYHHLLNDAELVLEKLYVIEREVKATSGKVFIMRVLPYRTAEDHINGVVVTFIDITSRKFAEQGLMASEEKFRNLFESIDEGFCISEVIFDEKDTAVDYRILEANAEFKRQNNVSDVTGKTARELQLDVHPAWLQYFGAVASTGNSSRFEGSVSAGGRWYSIYTSRIGGDGSRVIAVVYDDITDRKYRELNSVLLAGIAGDMVAMNKVEDIMQSAGERITRHFGLSRLTFSYIDEQAGSITTIYEKKEPGLVSLMGEQSMRAFITADFLQTLKKGNLVVANDIANDPHIASQKGMFKTKGVGAQLMAPFIADGHLTFIIIMQKEGPYCWRPDETALLEELAPRIYMCLQRVQSEEAVRQSEENYRTLLTSMDEGFYIVEPLTGENEKINDFRFLQVNPALYKNTGLQEILGKTFREILPDVPEIWLDIHAKVAASGQPVRFEMEIKNEPLKGWYDIYMQRIGRPQQRRVAVFIMNISVRKDMEKQKDEFIGIASHELKTPVTSIKAYAEVLQEKFRETNDVENVNLIQKLDLQIDRLTDLIHRMLDSAQVSEGLLSLNTTLFDINHLIKEEAEDMQRLSRRHQLVFMPDEAVKPVTADRGRIAEVMVNLISNAVKYSPDGGEIKITTAHTGEGVKVSVSDQGIGIPQNQVKHVFDRLFRVQHLKMHTFPGMGLGLYISAGIIYRHGGTIEVESEHGKGSVFTFVLPYNGSQQNN
ncbi:PAS domain S-box-containing protein [Chitinophaga sp. W3I9]|uniref:CheR family methyltransferase n=1 Tax=Chitinophaga sp. W3I9 TaxID=3373924 RepID=UPI003D1B10F2